jgi:hypothetical protein
LEYTPETFELIHRLVGYATAFIVAPAALFTFGPTRLHPRWGKTYAWLMVFLYCTGTFMTLTRHPWLSWAFARNITFNFFGFSMVLYGYRAMHLLRIRTDPRPARLDYMLGALLIGSVLAMLSVAVWKDTPMRVFTVIGIFLSVLEVRDLRRGFQPKDVLLSRHIRYILASYFYLLTVMSIVHLDRVLPKNAKWLWPTGVAVFVIYFAANKSKLSEIRSRATVLKWSVGLTLAVAFLFGTYLAVNLVKGTGP